ncbi:MAG: 2-C-methyl-D-erythritol 4-phosphate cytidylyltransferase [Endomicrobia bacterium]|nr:2-C-methyl-D-erythritol 4-phosphate cytidylyltransferase [Endomicrobiia bacterium]
MKAAAIIVAGGSGKRFGAKTPKQFLDLCGKPVFLWSVEAFASLKVFKQIIVVVTEQFISIAESVIERKGIALTKRSALAVSRLPYLRFAVIKGGKERFDSVKNGLKLVGKDMDYVAVHDAARPLINKKDIIAVLNKAAKYGAATAAEKTKDTIKTAVGGFVKKTLDRNVLWNVQTPQIFETGLLFKAYAKKIAKNTTDDSMLIEKSKKVAIAETGFPNFKITTPQDFESAKQILKSRCG